MSKCGFFPECEQCFNRENDPAICDDCEDADCFEPDDEDCDVEEDLDCIAIEVYKEAA